MDYEQKYKSLIAEIKERMALISTEKEKASSQIDKLSLGGRIAILRELLAFTHEFEESEDERIRKGLIKGLTAMKEIHHHSTFSDDAIEIADAIAWLEKQGEQKPSWSEEDEKMHEKLLFLMEEENSIPSWEGCYEWIKSLKDRVQPQPKQEWNEYDKIQLSEAIQMIEANGTWIRSEDAVKKVSNWLKSIKPNHWKPSEEQMNSLLALSVLHKESKALESLYNDLKKL